MLLTGGRTLDQDKDEATKSDERKERALSIVNGSYSYATYQSQSALHRIKALDRSSM